MNKYYYSFIKLAIKKLPKSRDDFQQLKKEISGKLGIFPPANADIRESYEKMANIGRIKRNEKFEKLLRNRPIRTESGVAVIAVMTKPYPCPGKCLYCPTERGMPKSYLSNEPAVMRAIKFNFNPYLQVQSRIKSLELNGHNTDKIELIVMGGTFSALTSSYQKRFICECYRACNEYPHHKTWNMEHGTNLEKILGKEQKKNEKSKHRIVGLTLETRPDYINKKEIINFRNLGCTRVELGVQSIYNDVLQKNKRGHLVEATIEATKLLKDFGFKINYHIMPGLYGSNLKKDYAMFKELFCKPDFQPDMLKIYPTVVTKNSALYRHWKTGKYKPTTDKKLQEFILKVKKEVIPPYVRISRLVRDVPSTSIVAGPTISNLRQLISSKSACRCIRCREVRSSYEIKEKIILNRIDYKASDGKEIFMQYVSPDKKKLFALLRLRIPSSACHLELFERSKKLDSSTTLRYTRNDNLFKFIPVLQNSAIIREVHTYGKLAKISKRDKTSPQHIGLGKKLIKEAERIAKEEFGPNKIVVIAGVGVREYYRKLGYKLENNYMVKYI